jgi:hypothetical protein
MVCHAMDEPATAGVDEDAVGADPLDRNAGARFQFTLV